MFQVAEYSTHIECCDRDLGVISGPSAIYLCISGENHISSLVQSFRAICYHDWGRRSAPEDDESSEFHHDFSSIILQYLQPIHAR